MRPKWMSFGFGVTQDAVSAYCNNLILLLFELLSDKFVIVDMSFRPARKEDDALYAQ